MSPKDNEVVLTTANVTNKIGNIFDTVLVLSHHYRTLKSQQNPIITKKQTLLTQAMCEIAQGKVDKKILFKHKKD